VAIYHLSVKPISRSAGRSATAAAAYRSACALVDERTGLKYDYRRKGGVLSSDIVLPANSPAWASSRSALWNAAERAEKRKDACVAREYEVALPCELSRADRRTLVLTFARRMADEEGCAVDASIHAPDAEGDDRNEHAHILRTTRKIGEAGLGDKLETEKAGRKRKDDLEKVRELWEKLANAALEAAGHDARIDRRSLEAQGIDREPTRHLGPAAVGFERRTEKFSDKREGWSRPGADRAAEVAAVDQQILALAAERDRLVSAENFSKAESKAKAAAKAAAEEARTFLPQDRASIETVSDLNRKLVDTREALSKMNSEALSVKQQLDRAWPAREVGQARERANDLLRAIRHKQAVVSASHERLEGMPWWRLFAKRAMKIQVEMGRAQIAVLTTDYKDSKKIAKAPIQDDLKKRQTELNNEREILIRQRDELQKRVHDEEDKSSKVKVLGRAVLSKNGPI
jgi:hypothetical protein